MEDSSKDDTFTMSKSTFYLVVIGLLVVLLFFSIITQGFGIVKPTPVVVPTTNGTLANPTPTPTPSSGVTASAKLKEYAQKIGLDTAKFNTCLDTLKYSKEIQKDFSDGLALGIQGTPSFMIGKRDGAPQTLVGAQPYSVFKAAIEAELANTNQTNVTTKTSSFAGDDPKLGLDSAPILIIEFSDFQCPFCERFYSGAYQNIQTDYVKTGKVQIVYRDFPLSNIHPKAELGAEAANCAFEQGKFEEMHNMLFQNQNEWSSLN